MDKEKYLYTLDGKQILHKNGKPVIFRDYVKRVKIRGFDSAYYGTMRVITEMPDGRKVKVETDGFKTLKDIVNETIKGLGE